MMHQHHPAEYERPHRCTELDPRHCVEPTVHGGDPDIRDADGSVSGGETEHLGGFIVRHARPGQADEGPRCASHADVDPHFQRPRWEMAGSLEGGDLTLRPSLLCGRCGDHGFIRDGKWVPA